MTDNVIQLDVTDGRKDTWTFPDGTIVTIEVPVTEPPITVKHAIYCCSAIVHLLHTAIMT